MAVRTLQETLRLWLRRLMLVVAGAALVGIILSAVIPDPSGDARQWKEILEGLTALAVLLTCFYYGFKGMRWLWRRLLWRVRRRLVITYLLVGLTPIVLLALLGLMVAMAGSAEAMARILAVQLSTYERQTAAAARGIVEDLQAAAGGIAAQSDTPAPPAGGAAIRSWLEGRAAPLRAALPGARAAIWLAGPGVSQEAIGHEVSGIGTTPSDPGEIPKGHRMPEPDAPLPAWLRGQTSWSGLAYSASEKEEEGRFSAPELRALARGSLADRPFAVLVSVPIGRTIVARLNESSGFKTHLYFRNPREFAVVLDGAEPGSGRTRIDEEEIERRVRASLADPNGARERETTDQLGEPRPEVQYIATYAATEWAEGSRGDAVVFLFRWSWAEAMGQVMGGSAVGRALRVAILIVGAIFLFFELVALGAAIWMTRAITGTVHELHHATGLIDRGDFSYRARVRSHDQLGELAEGFNTMSGHIEALLRERVESEKLEREVEIAAQVQSQLFPRSVPLLSTAQIAAECRAARGVAGDYYDYLEVGPSLVLFALGDVSGKGISASLVMSNLQAALRAHTGVVAHEFNALIAAGGTANGHGPVSHVTGIVNEQLCRSTDPNRYATLFLALYDDRTGSLRYTNAGHNAAILVHPDGSAIRLAPSGTIVGAFEEARYSEMGARLAPGSLLVIFSDGISDAENAAGEYYGEDRLLRLAVESRRETARDILGAVFAEIDRWSDGQERGDDQTLLIVKADAKPDSA